MVKTRRRPKHRLAKADPEKEARARRLQEERAAARQSGAKTIRQIFAQYPDALWLFDGHDRKYLLKTAQLGEGLHMLHLNEQDKLLPLSREGHAEELWQTLIDYPGRWHGSNLYGVVDGEHWYLRLMATGIPREEDLPTLEAVLRGGHGHVFRDMNLGNTYPDDDLWVMDDFAMESPDMVLVFGMAGEEQTHVPEFLAQQVVVQHGHIYALDPRNGRRFYLLTDLTLLDGVQRPVPSDEEMFAMLRESGQSHVADRLTGRIYDSAIGTSLGNPGEAIISEHVTDWAGEWIISATELRDGFHHVAISKPAIADEDQITRNTVVPYCLGAQAWESVSEATAAGARFIERNGGTAVHMSPTIFEALNRVREQAEQRDRLEEARREFRRHEALGRRSDAPLIRSLWERYGREVATHWQNTSHVIYLGPIQDDLKDRIDQLSEAVPRLDYRPFRSMLFDFGVGVEPVHFVSATAGTSTEDHIIRQWVRVSDAAYFVEHLLRTSPWVTLRHYDATALNDKLVVECIVHLIDEQRWNAPTVGLIDVEDWRHGLVIGMPTSDVLNTEQKRTYGDMIKSGLFDGALALAYLAQMPERLYEIRNPPRGPMKEGAAKPWTRTGLPHYRPMDPTTAPVPKREHQGGTHASPKPHERRANRHTFFARRYYQGPAIDVIGEGRATPPLLPEMHYRHDRFVSGRRGDGTPEVWMLIGAKWYPLRVRDVYVGSALVGISEEEAMLGYTVEDTFYRVVDPRERMARKPGDIPS